MINKKIINNLFCTGLLVLLLGTLLSSCDFLDPTPVKNPQITEESLRENAAGGAQPLIIGLRRTFAATMGSATAGPIPISDLTSDNCVNVKTLISVDLDYPDRILYNDGNTGGCYNSLLSLYALADFGVKTVLPSDPLATIDQKAEVHFYKGISLMLLAESYTLMVIEEYRPPITATEARTLGIQSLKTAFDMTADANMKVNCKLALARIYRSAGDKANAEIEAKAALALRTDYVFYAVFDASTLTNNMYAYLVSRADNDIQPLPRLDFLDPKYSTSTTSIPVLKSEEAHLILAEISIANNDLTGAKTSMINAITLARSRPTVTYNDKDSRTNRPNDPTYKVKASPTADTVGGLIQKRGGSSIVTVYPISYTSLTANYVNSLTDKKKIIRALYLLRQEIFFLEGRRSEDLGIKFPISFRQVNTNSYTPVGSPGALSVIPDYIPLSNAMDKFTVDANTKTVTIDYDMNQVIADNYDRIKPFK